MALAALPAAPASADRSAGRAEAVVSSPRQVTTCHLADGRTVPCTVRSHFVVLEGDAARGQARLEHEGPGGESLVVKVTYLAARLVRSEDGHTVVFQGKGEVCTFRSACQPLEGLWGTVGPSPGAGGDILIYDIQDGFVYEGASFHATGDLTVHEVWDGSF